MREVVFDRGQCVPDMHSREEPRLAVSLDVDIDCYLRGGTYVGAPVGKGEVLRPFLAAGIGA